MKKTLLLSVVASTMIMAGGDIAPVEPAVETPAPAVSGWEFSGTGKVYYQTADMGGDLFDQETSAADLGLQLRATNSDVFAGIGAGMEVSGLSTLNLENWMVSNVMQGTGNLVPDDIDDVTDGGWISQLYLTYGIGNTSFKVGRQELPKALSPFAFSEDWNVFKNTFDAVLVVNTDIQDTTLVGAWVGGANQNAFGAGNNITDFNSINDDDGAYMLTVQNKSIENLTLTGSWYYIPNLGNNLGATPEENAANVLWGDAQYNADMFHVGIQGGSIMSDDFNDDTTAFGAKVGGTVSGINLMAAYSTVNDGDTGMFNIGGTTSALYTETVADQLLNAPFYYGIWTGYTRRDADKFVVGANADVLGGNLSAAYAYSEITPVYHDHELNEFDLCYSANVTDSLNLTAAYVYLDDSTDSWNQNADSNNIVRLIGTYNF